MKIQIIAEAGVNHSGDLDTAFVMVDAAVAAGADIVKFQTYSPEHAIHDKHPDYKLLASLALPRIGLVRLKRHCEASGIEFLSTPGDVESLKFLANELGVKRLKIGSDDLTYKPLIEAAAATRLPLILSTGMATETDILETLEIIGYDYNDITLLHCVSSYPCAAKDVNLKAMDTMKKFGWPVGYSDHTNGILACIAAAARGAVMIEKHFMLSLSDPVDKNVSVTDPYLKDMVIYIRGIEKMLGTGVKAPCEAELKLKPLVVKDASGRKTGMVQA